MVSRFSARVSAEEAMATNMTGEASILDEGFEALDDVIRRLGSLDTPFGRVCALTSLKARNLIVAMYSLAMDGLAQEAGAILRPLIGTIEKLEYYRKAPEHIEEAIEGRLPSEGIIAKRIAGDFQELREYLSQYASHSTFSYESYRHLLDPRQGTPIFDQPFIETTFRKNLEMVFSFLVISANEAYRCLEHAGERAPELLTRIDDVRIRGASIIPPD